MPDVRHRRVVELDEDVRELALNVVAEPCVIRRESPEEPGLAVDEGDRLAGQKPRLDAAHVSDLDDLVIRPDRAANPIEAHIARAVRLCRVLIARRELDGPVVDHRPPAVLDRAAGQAWHPVEMLGRRLEDGEIQVDAIRVADRDLVDECSDERDAVDVAADQSQPRCPVVVRELDERLQREELLPRLGVGQDACDGPSVGAGDGVDDAYAIRADGDVPGERVEFLSVAVGRLLDVGRRRTRDRGPDVGVGRSRGVPNAEPVGERRRRHGPLPQASAGWYATTIGACVPFRA